MHLPSFVHISRINRELTSSLRKEMTNDAGIFPAMIPSQHASSIVAQTARRISVKVVRNETAGRPALFFPFFAVPCFAD